MHQSSQQSPLVSRAFKPSAWLANIDFMKHLILEKHLLLVVMSEAGGGKSTFVDLMRLRLDSVIQSVLLDIDVQSPMKSMLQVLAPLLNVPLPEASLVAGVSLSHFFEQLLPQKQPLLFVIEHAQTLPEPFLIQLMNVYRQWGREKNFTICLVSDFSLTPVLQRLERLNKAAFIHTIEPGPLTEDETKTYVLKYCQGRPAFEKWSTPAQLKAFYQSTAGQMIKINQQLTALQAELTVPTRFEQAGVIAKRSLPAVSALALLVAMVCYGWVLWQPVASEISARLMSVVSRQPLPAPVLKSQIAPWYQGVQVAEVAPPPLQRLAEAAVDESDQEAHETSDAFVVVDKVVVLPEIPPQFRASLRSELTPIPTIS